MARWLVAPAVVALLALVGLAVSTEDRGRFEDRVEANSESSSDAEQFEPDSDQGFDWGFDQAADGSTGSGDEPGSSSPSQTPTPDGFDGEAGSDPGPDGRPDVFVPVDVEIRSPTGTVGLDLGGGPLVAWPSDSTGTTTGPVPLSPAPAGDVDLRLSPDGTLEPVDAGQVEGSDIAIRPLESGVDLIRPDGDRIELRENASTSEVVAIEQSLDGTARQLTPDEHGEIDVGDGITIAVSQPQPSLWQQATSTPWRWIFIGNFALVVASLALAYYMHRIRPREPFGIDFVGPAGVPSARFDEFAAQLLADPDPARAIRLAFQAAERGAGGAPARHNTETPFEWSNRVGHERPEVAQPLSTLCALFATARFAPERPSAADQERAVAALRQVHHRGSHHSAESTSDLAAAGNNPDVVGADVA